MPYQIEMRPRAESALARLEPGIRRRIGAAIDGLALDPRPPGVKKMRGRDQWRIRVGDYRVVYEIEDAVLRVLVVEVGHRREVYQ